MSRTLFLLMLMTGLAWNGHAAQRVTALGVEGQAQVQEPGSSEWKKLVKGAVLSEGACVSTQEGASCLLGFEGDKKGALKIKPGSTLALKNLGEPTQMSLEEGGIFVKLRNLKKESRFEVISPTATATVRGTGWSQSADRMEVFEGSVHVLGFSGDQTDLAENQAVSIDTTGHLGEIGPADEESKQAWNDFSRNVEQMTTWSQEPFEDFGAHSGEDMLEAKDEQHEFEKENDLLGEMDDRSSGGAYGG